jgi:hypothetical protein
MKMIAHENKADNRNVEALRGFFQKHNEMGLIFFTAEDSFARVASRAQVIGRALKLNAHARAISTAYGHEEQMSNIEI